MEFDEIKELLEIALDQLKRNDLYLLEQDISERSISHKLACYLAKLFPNYDVDCEYNGNIEVKSKKKFIMIIRDEADRLGLLRENEGGLDDEFIYRNVFPDIIIHRRGNNDQNLLIIEMKKTSSNVASDYDHLKLRMYTSSEIEESLNYSFGAFIYIGVGDSFGDDIVEWFQDGNKLNIHE